MKELWSSDWVTYCVEDPEDQVVTVYCNLLCSSVSCDLKKIYFIYIMDVLKQLTCHFLRMCQYLNYWGFWLAGDWRLKKKSVLRSKPSPSFLQDFSSTSHSLMCVTRLTSVWKCWRFLFTRYRTISKDTYNMLTFRSTCKSVYCICHWLFFKSHFHYSTFYRCLHQSRT